MTHIVIDSTPLENANQGRGVGTYIKGLTRALKLIRTDLDITPSSNPEALSADLVHYPYFDLFFHTLHLPRNTRSVVTVHDVIPLIFPNQFPPGVKGKLNFLLQKRTLLKVDAIITDSKSSKKDIAKYFQYPTKRIHVIYLAASPKFSPASSEQIKRFKQKYSLPNTFISYVGDINYNKNLFGLIAALQYLPDITLAIATRANLRNPSTEAQTKLVTTLIQRAISQLSNPNQVRLLTIRSQKELAALYSASHFYVQPSFYEGFGFPVLEALSCHTPVISSNQSSLPEVAGPAAIYFNPHKPQELIQALKRGFGLSATQRQVMIHQSIKQSRRFSWVTTAQHTLNVYRQVLNS